MNQIARLPAKGSSLLPVHETDELKGSVLRLGSINSGVNDVLNRLESGDYDPRRAGNALANVERDLEKLGELPSDTANVMVLLDQAMQEATPEQIADALTVLHGLFDSRGEPQIMASTGVEIIEAEHASAIALYSTVLAMLRPPSKTRKHGWDDRERAPLRKFLPTIPEILAELQDQQEWWKEKQKCLKGYLTSLRERHTQARRGLTKHIEEARALVP